MSDKNKIEINISGYSYTLVGKESTEYLNGLASYISNKINKIMCSNNNLGIKDAGILTALNVADELFKLQRESENNEKDIKAKEENKKLEEKILKLKQENGKLRGEIFKLNKEIAKLKENSFFDKSDNDLKKELRKAYDSISNLLLERDKILEDLAKEKEKNTNLHFSLVELKSSIVEDKLQ